MQKLNIAIRRTAAGLAAIMIALMMCMTVPAVHAAESGKLTIFSRSGGIWLEGMQWKIYPAVFADENGGLYLSDTFAEYPISLADTSTSGMQEIADTMENYAVIHDLAPLDSQSADANGVVQFTVSEPGYYLVAGEAITVGEQVYYPSPMLVEMTEESGAIADLSTYAKFSVRDIGVGTSEVLTLRKVWQDDDDAAGVRAVSIELELYCNGELYETVVLNHENEWTYAWTGDLDDDWRILEVNVPEYYSVIYKRSEVQLLAVNTLTGQILTPPETTTTTTTTTTTVTSVTTVTTTTTASGTSVTDTSTDTETDTSTNTDTSKVTTTTKTVTTTKTSGGSKLPQTGQLWWPVPVMGVSGVLLLVFGWIASSRSRNGE